MVRTAYSNVKQLTRDEEERVLQCLSESALARLRSKKNAELCRRSLSAYALLAEQMGEQAFRKAVLSFSRDGRPYFENLDSDVSLTHTSNVIACAYSDSRDERVGIDAEEARLSPDKIQNLSKRFFTEGEKVQLSDGADFFEIWTKKEALFKCLGEETPFTLLDSSRATGVVFETFKFDDTVITVCRKKL